MSAKEPVLLEQGKTWVFASALAWPGWCRRGKGEEAALEALLEYVPRYRQVIGRTFKPGELSVVETVQGNATTDFGAPAIVGRRDHTKLTGPAARRLLTCLEKSWEYFDAVVAGAPQRLRKGPRGGGRDRDAIVDHVREAERAYGRKVGVRVPPRAPWPQQRAETLEGLRHPAHDIAWPTPYLIRRTAWHVLDHAWEIEDRSQ